MFTGRHLIGGMRTVLHPRRSALPMDTQLTNQSIGGMPQPLSPLTAHSQHHYRLGAVEPREFFVRVAANRFQHDGLHSMRACPCCACHAHGRQMDAAVVLCVVLREVATPRVCDTDVLEISLSQPAGSVGTINTLHSRERRARTRGPPVLNLLGIDAHTPCEHIRDAVASLHAAGTGSVSVTRGSGTCCQVVCLDRGSAIMSGMTR